MSQPTNVTTDELLGYVVGEILVLPYYKPTVRVNESVSLTRDKANIWDDHAIQVVNTTTNDPHTELVGYLEHPAPSCALCGLLDSDLIKIRGFVPEITQAELNGLNIPCRIDIYSGRKNLKSVKSATKSGGLKFFPAPKDRKQNGVGCSNKKISGVDSSKTEAKPMTLGGNCGIFSNKTCGDVWAYIEENKLHDPANKEFVLCDENLRKIFRKRRVKIPNFTSLIKLLIYEDKLHKS